MHFYSVIAGFFLEASIISNAAKLSRRNLRHSLAQNSSGSLFSQCLKGLYVNRATMCVPLLAIPPPPLLLLVAILPILRRRETKIEVERVRRRDVEKDEVCDCWSTLEKKLS